MKPDTPQSALRLGVLLWSRVHGLVTLEISGAYASMGLDGADLLAAEVDTVLTAVST